MEAGAARDTQGRGQLPATGWRCNWTPNGMLSQTRAATGAHVCGRGGPASSPTHHVQVRCSRQGSQCQPNCNGVARDQHSKATGLATHMRRAGVSLFKHTTARQAAGNGCKRPIGCLPVKRIPPARPPAQQAPSLRDLRGVGRPSRRVPASPVRCKPRVGAPYCFEQGGPS